MRKDCLRFKQRSFRSLITTRVLPNDCFQGLNRWLIGVPATISLFSLMLACALFLLELLRLRIIFIQYGSAGGRVKIHAVIFILGKGISFTIFEKSAPMQAIKAPNHLLFTFE